MIELLEEKDIESYIKLIKESFNYQAKYNDIIDMMKDYQILVIKDKEKVVASAAIIIVNDYIQNMKKYHIDYVCVSKDYQRNHLATKLFDYIYQMANKDHINVIELTSSIKREAANKFYIKEQFIMKDSHVFLKFLED